MIGVGASGVVYLGVDHDTKAHRAIKMLNKGDVSDMTRVDQEIKVKCRVTNVTLTSLRPC